MRSILLVCLQVLLWSHLIGASHNDTSKELHAPPSEPSSQTNHSREATPAAKTSVSHELVPSNDIHHSHAKHSGFPYLEEHAAESFAKFTDMTYAIHKKGLPSVKGFVCLNPHAKSYGGMGNLFVGAIGMQFYAFSSGRIVIFNNALITDLFNHPDPRQSWVAIPTPVVNGPMKKSIVGVAAAKLVQDPKTVKHKFIGSHGGPIMNVAFDHFVKKNLTSIMFPTHETKTDLNVYRNIACQGFASWIMSNLTERAERALDTYKSNFINTCGGDNKPDLSIQARVLDDKYFKQYDMGQIECILSCAVKKAQQLAEQRTSDVCIFVTSNRLDLTDMIVDRMKEALNSGSSSDQFKFLSHHIDPVQNMTTAMHSGKLVEAARNVETLDIDYSEHADIMDWLILGEAVHSLNTAGSTFTRTARLRVGNPERHIFNPLQNDLVALWDNAKKACSCKNVAKHCTGSGGV